MFSGDVCVSWASDISFVRYKNIIFISTGMGDVSGENFVVVNVDTSKILDYDLICLSDPDLDCLGDIEDYMVVNEPTGLTNCLIRFRLKLFLCRLLFSLSHEEFLYHLNLYYP